MSESQGTLLVVGVVVIGGAAFLLLGPTGKAEAATREREEDQDPEEKKTKEEPGFLDSLVSGLGSGFGSFFGAAGEGLGSAIGALAEKSAESGELQRSGRKLSQFGERSLQSTPIAKALGIRKETSRDRQKKKRQAENIRQGVLADMEAFAARAHLALARSDVREWVIDSDGTIFVFYQGIKDPFKIRVPERATNNRLAWSAEPVVRALGYFQQRGYRLTGPFVRYDPPAFSDANPYAPRLETRSFEAQRQGSPENTLKRADRLKRKLKKVTGEDPVVSADEEQPAEEPVEE